MRNRGSRSLPYPKYVKRREEGKCFHCGGAYNLGHRCPEKNLSVIILAEEEGNGEVEESGEMRRKSAIDEIINFEHQCMELSLFFSWRFDSISYYEAARNNEGKICANID